MSSEAQESHTRTSRRSWAMRDGYFWVEGFKLFRKVGDTLLFWDRQRRREIPLTRQELTEIFESK